MIKLSDIYMPLDYTDDMLLKKAAKTAGIRTSDIKSIKTVRKAVDARKRNDVHFTVSVALETKNEDAVLKRLPGNKASRLTEERYVQRPAANKNSRPIVAGFGPAGIFAALTLARSGLRPTVLERGSDCDARMAAVEDFRKNGVFSERTNVQFGEGGAGTFSDGKLTTGIRDRRIRHVFETFVSFGAPEDILYSARPHIGTDVLTEVIRNIRQELIRLGANIVFDARLTDILSKDGRVSGAVYEKDGKEYELPADSLILACGHSARDTFELLQRKGIAMSSKSFAMGVRIEHLQSDVNSCLYGSFAGHPALPPADYKYAVHLPGGRSVFTFCMCPGGEVIAGASEKGSVVTNGMSKRARSMTNANAALLVNTDPGDLPSDDVLAGICFQRSIEQAAFRAGGGNYGAPVTLAGDLLSSRLSTSFGSVMPSYIPSVSFARAEDVLPGFITEALIKALPELAKKAEFFSREDAVITMPETRSSSPVRIERSSKLESVTLGGLYPCGEGAGWAGGIVSAAVDGIKCGEAVSERV